MQNGFLRIALIATGVLGLTGLASAQAYQERAAQPAPVIAWIPKPIELTPYAAPHKPHTKLAEVLQQHQGEARWREPVVNDPDLRADWVQMAPGDKTPTVYAADHRTSFIVWDGQVRVSIGGQEPFVASKGFMVQVPYRTAFSLETVGDAPSLYFQVSNADATLLYPEGDTPPPPPEGTEWYRGRLQGQDTYERQNSAPYLDFFAATAQEPGPRGAFTRDDRSFLNIIRGQGIPRPADTERGHFHVNYAEFWFVMEGQISYLIEGVPYFVADPGDIVYAAPGRFHRAAWAGEGMSTRIAINGYPGGSHHYEPPH